MDNPRAGTFCLLLAIGLGVWSVVNSLDNGQQRLRLRDPSNRSPAALKTPSSKAAAQTPSIIDTLDPAYLMEGRVAGPGGKPIENALVRCGNLEVRSDKEGIFKLPRGSRNIELSHPDYFPGRLESLAVQAAAPGGNSNRAGPASEAILQPGYSLGGTVYDSTGKPLGNSKVSFRTSSAGYCGSVKTSPDGTWSSPLLQLERTHILYNHPGCLTRFAWATPSGPGQKKPLETVLHQGTPARIRVVDERGSYLAEAQAWSDRPVSTGEADSVGRYLGRTDDLGLLECALEQGAPGRIRVRHVGYEEKIIEASTAENSETPGNFEITLLRGPVLLAHAIDNSTGLPLRPETVEVEVRTDGDFHPAGQAGLLYHSLDGGEIRVGLPRQAGKFRLRVSGGGNLYGVSPVVDFDGTTSPEPCLVRLRPSRSQLQGLVTFEQEAVPRAQVELLTSVGTWAGHTMLHGIRVPRPSRAVMSTYTDPGGNFSFRQFEPGTYRIRVTHPRYAAYQGAPIALPLPDPSQKHPLILGSGAAIEGRVRSLQGKPLESVPVVLSCAECLPQSTWTDHQGRYSFSGLPTATDIQVSVGNSSADTPGKDAGWTGRGRSVSQPVQNLQLSPGERREVDLTSTGPQENGGLNGTLTLDGKPFATPLELMSLPELGHSPKFSSDENGGFSMAPLPAGRYRLSSRGFPFQREVNVEAGKTTGLSVSLQTLAYDLEIASAANGEPIRSPCTITAELLNPTAARKNGAPWTKREILAPGGNVVLDGLFPLAYRLRIEAPGHVPASVKINPAKNPRGRASLKKGKKTRLDLKKPNGEIFTGEVSVVIFEDTGVVIHDEKVQVSGELELPALPPGIYKVEVRTRKKPYRMTLTISGS
jgi:hypothetical protein